MAAPTATTRQTPVGIRLREGHSTKIAFALDPDVSFWETTVKRSSTDGGEAIDDTNMHNVEWRVQRPRTLKSKGPVTGTAFYDPDVENQIDALINQEGAITVHLPDGSKDIYWGFLKSVDYAELQEGVEPTLTYEVIVSNWDPENNVEAGPVTVSAPGT